MAKKLTEMVVPTVMQDLSMTIAADVVDTAKPEETENLTQGFVKVDAPVDNIPPTQFVPQMQIASNSPFPKEMYEEGWTDNVLNQLWPTEKVATGRKDYPFAPKAVGLRRIFEKIIGTIEEYDVIVHQLPEPQNGNRATIAVRMKYRPHGTVFGNGHMIVMDAADCYPGNTADPYCRYPVATATTIAEGRALRKGLRINVLTMEELQAAPKEQVQESEGISRIQNLASDNQHHAIKTMAKELGIDGPKLLQYLNINVFLEEITVPEAHEIIRTLGSFKRGVKNGGQAIPESLILK